jgi:hypothetical protein
MDLMEEKALLLEVCKRLVEGKIKTAHDELESYNAQSKEETKSSAGDKYETTRAMIHLEKEKISIQLNESLKLQQIFEMIRPNPDSSGIGKMLVTDQGRFFIAASLGLVESQNEKYYVLSPVAPLGRLLSQSKKGDVLTFNTKKYKVLDLA